GVERFVDREDLGETGDFEHLEDAALGADQREIAIVAPEPLESAHQDAETGGVEEVDGFEVDDDLVLALADELDEALAEPRRGVDVDLPPDGEHGPAVPLVDIQAEIHRSSSGAAPNLPSPPPGATGSVPA